MMDLHNIINLTDDEISNPGEPLDRRAILTPAIQRTIAALGGIEGGVYQLGDECYGCLKDLKKFWRKDDTDDERTVARIIWECRLLENDLVPILLETAGKGAVMHKCAIAVADLLTAMTWPIDLAEELTELDEERDGNTDYMTLIHAQLAYKAALLQPGVVKALIDIAIPYIAKDKRDRTERDGQVVNVILHLFRNLAFIKDMPPNAHLSSDRAELSSLQVSRPLSDPVHT
jgi:replication fork protection complex subunit Tof1/Swi1